MRTYPGLKFVILIVVGLCGAMVLRAFAANKHKGAGLFTLEIHQRVKLKCGKKCKDEIMRHLDKSPSYDVCFRDDTTAGDDEHWQKPQDKGNPCPKPTHYGSPHIQQRAEFATPKDLKAAVDALVGAISSVAPAPSASPAPHIQQQVESNTPKAGKVIAEALAR